MNARIAPGDIHSAHCALGSKRMIMASLVRSPRFAGAPFVAVGDGKPEREAAEAAGIPFVHIAGAGDLAKALHVQTGCAPGCAPGR